MIKNFIPTIFSCLILISPELASQSQNGTITGKVVNMQTEEPLIGVSVVVVGTTIGAATNEEGLFTIQNVPVGTYSIRASAVGFQPIIKTDVVVAAGKPAQRFFQMTELVLDVDEVTVTADYFQKNVDSPVSVQSLGYEEIRRIPGGLEDVVRAVSILPGVAQVQPGRNDLIVRGGAPSENLFVVDNIEVPNINHFGTQGASGGPLSFINLDFVNETSFSSGGFGARYGDKLSSVLSINLRDGRTDRFGGKATISASQFGLNLEGPLGDDGTALFSARRSYLDFIFKAAGFGFVPEYWDFLGKANYRLGLKDQVTFLGIAALDNVKLFNDTEKKKYDNSRILYSDQNQGVAGITWRHLLPKGYSNVTLSQTLFTYEYRQDDALLLAPIFSSSSHEYETALRSDVVLQLDKSTEFSAGAEGKRVDFSSRILLPKFYTNYGDSLDINARLDTTAYKAAIYAQVAESFSHHFTMTVGARADYFNLIEKTYVVSPRFSMSYTITSATTVSFSVGRYYQAPSYIWLVANPANRTLSFVGANQYVVGVEQLLRTDTKISLEVYLKNYFDYPASLNQKFLVLANTGAGFGGSQEAYASFGIDPLVSGGSGKASGVELFLQKKMSEIPCYGLVSVSYTDSRFTALDGISRPSNFNQRWILNIGGGYIMEKVWEFSAKFRFATGRPYTPYNADGTQEIASYNTARIGANHSLDIRAERRWNFTEWNLMTYIDIQNIYNRRPLDVPVFDERTREVKQLSNTIGILPSIGVSAEF
jgi:TonB dependent receptor/CarboxypepD_reg-like domain/TonB-dependent Receptor Plug Domain